MKEVNSLQHKKKFSHFILGIKIFFLIRNISSKETLDAQAWLIHILDFAQIPHMMPFWTAFPFIQDLSNLQPLSCMHLMLNPEHTYLWSPGTELYHFRTTPQRCPGHVSTWCWWWDQTQSLEIGLLCLPLSWNYLCLWQNKTKINMIFHI